MREFHDSNGNGLGDIWWTDKYIYFSIIDYTHYKRMGYVIIPKPIVLALKI